MEYIDDHPAFTPRRKSGPWRFKLEAAAHVTLPRCVLPAALISPMQGRWCQIGPHGDVVIPAGYAWDGCTPKCDVAGLLLLGTPDGRYDIATGQPMTYYASLFHDALLQYYAYHELSVGQVNRLFLAMLRGRIRIQTNERTLRPNPFPLAPVYYAAVQAFARFGLPPKAEGFPHLS